MRAGRERAGRDGGAEPILTARQRAVRRDAAVVVAVATFDVVVVALAASLGGSEAVGAVAQWVLLVTVWTLAAWFTALRSRLDPRRTRHGHLPSTGGWLTGATASDGGIDIPARPADQGCDLAIRAGGVVVSAGWSSATLPWNQFRSWRGPLVLRPGPLDPSTEGDTWAVSPYGGAQDAVTGIGLEVSGRVIEATERVRAQRSKWWNRLLRSGNAAVRVPLAPARVADALLDDERDVVAALFQVLAERPGLRARLDDPIRTRRLVHDLTHRPMGAIADRDPVFRHRFEIVSALKRLGYTHRLLGRPLPDDALASEAEVLDRLTRDLRANPFSREIRFSSEELRMVVRERYLVEAWPFAALLR